MCQTVYIQAIFRPGWQRYIVHIYFYVFCQCKTPFTSIRLLPLMYMYVGSISLPDLLLVCAGGCFQRTQYLTCWEETGKVVQTNWSKCCAENHQETASNYLFFSLSHCSVRLNFGSRLCLYRPVNVGLNGNCPVKQSSAAGLPLLIVWYVYQYMYTQKHIKCMLCVCLLGIVSLNLINEIIFNIYLSCVWKFTYLLQWNMRKNKTKGSCIKMEVKN